MYRVSVSTKWISALENQLCSSRRKDDMEKTTFSDLYTTGEYLKKNPTWHVEESPWKAKQILHMMARQMLTPTKICEIGCGVGEVLKQLQDQMDTSCQFWGYDISPQAIQLATPRAN